MEQTARYNAEKREQFWQEKFKKECVDVKHDNQEDLLEMFAGIQQKDVPVFVAAAGKNSSNQMQKRVQMAPKVSNTVKR